MSDNYTAYKERLAAQQASKSHDEILADMQQKAEHVFDPATAQPIAHNWVDRGMKLSCEGAGHDYHQAWKRQVGTPMV